MQRQKKTNLSLHASAPQMKVFAQNMYHTRNDILTACQVD